MFSYINIHTHSKPSLPDELVIRNVYLQRITREIRVSYPISIGLHPWHVHTMSPEMCEKKLLDYINHNSVWAIGEIGIDRHINTSFAIQKYYFELQLEIARAYKKPVIIHSVKSLSDILPYVRKSSIPFIVHRFQGNEQQAHELIRHGAILSFGDGLFGEKNGHLFSKLSDTSYFLETDTARNVTIADIYAKASELKKIPLAALIKMQMHTFAQIFKRTL